MSSGIFSSVVDGQPPVAIQQTRVLVVDRDPTMQERIRHLIEEEGLECCGEAADDGEAVECMSRTAPHVVLASLSLTAAGALELIRRIKAASPGTPVLVFAMEDARTYGGRAIRAGASAYVMKDDEGVKLVAALRRLSGAGGVVHSTS
jgi:DNA-binding NarL/FixJ family response regulator